MNTKKTTILGLLAVIAIVMGGIGFALAQDYTVDTNVCDGTGVLGLMNGRGFWSQLSEEQRTQLATQTQEMLQLGASQDEIRAMKATKLQEWGIDAPQWSGPHAGAQGGHGQMLRDGSGSGGQYGGCGSGNHGRQGGNGYNGVCPN
jgi:hypothetical protein